MNYKAIDAGRHRLSRRSTCPPTGPTPWTSPIPRELEGKPELVKMVKEILEPVGKMDGDSLPVSAFVRARGRPVRAGRFRLREARRGRVRSHLGRRQVHPVQPVRLCLPPRHHPSLRSDRRGGQERSRRPPRSWTSRPARARASISSPWPSVPSGLHGLRRLRRRLPREAL